MCVFVCVCACVLGEQGKKENRVFPHRLPLVLCCLMASGKMVRVERGKEQPLHACWPVLYSQAGEREKGVAATLYVAVNVVESDGEREREGDREGLQALVSIHDDGHRPLHTFFLYDRGRLVSPAPTVLLQADAMVMSVGGEGGGRAIFPTAAAAAECHNTIVALQRGDVDNLFPVGSDGGSREDGDGGKGVLEGMTVEEILQILQSPDFPLVLQQVESLLAKNPFLLDKFQ